MPEQPNTPAIPLDQIDADAQKVIRRLTRNGYEAFLVGGCVRDLLLHRTPKDFDVATSATPAEIRDIFRNCRIIGRRFRLAHVFFGSKIIETATFRANPREVLGGGEELTDEEDAGELLIQRDNVFGTAEEDARRRDFTINGLFYDLESMRVIDYVEGQRDLARRSICTIGDPDIRFREDPVRILRAIKFAARLGFDIEDRTYRAITTHAGEITKSAPPRVMEEIYRLLRGGAALESLVLLTETGLMHHLLPELSERLEADPTQLDPYLQAMDTLVKLGHVPQNATVLCLLAAPRLAPLFDEHESDRGGDPMALIDSALGPLIDRMRVSRRDGERARQVLLAQRRLWQLRRRGGKVATLTMRDWFTDALLTHYLYLLARGMSAEQAQTEINGWLRHHPPQAPLPQPLPMPPVASVGEALDDGEPRRRRRRRKRPGTDMDSAAERQVTTPASAPVIPRSDVVSDDEEPIKGEQEVLDAFTAALKELDG